MLQVLLRSTVVLIITFVALIGVVRYTAQAIPAPQHLFSFDPPDCYLPCVFGVTPGKTTLAKYKELLASKVPVAQQAFDSNYGFWLQDDSGTRINFSTYADNDNHLIQMLMMTAYGGKIVTL